MGFIQIIEYTTTRKDEVDKIFEKWRDATKGKRTASRAIITSDRDQANRYIEIVSFPSYEEAMKNSELPETNEIAEQMNKLCDGEMTFRNLDVIREESL
jgi:hypothetical protein